MNSGNHLTESPTHPFEMSEREYDQDKAHGNNCKWCKCPIAWDEDECKVCKNIKEKK